MTIIQLTYLTDTIEAVQGCSIFYQSDFKSKKALCDSEVSRLTQIPSDLPENLVELRIMHQSIKHISKQGLNRLLSLEMLQIESSHLKQIEPDTFSYLSSLKHLNLRNNSLRIATNSLPMEIFRDLPNLRVLNLAENPIEIIPDYFFENLRVTKLQYLWMGSLKVNRLKSENKAFSALPHLMMMDLSFAGLNNLPLSFEIALSGMPDLRELYLGGNPWHCDCKVYWLSIWFTRKSSKTLSYIQNKTDVNGHLSNIQPVCYSPEHLKGRLIFSHGSKSLNLNNMTCEGEIFTNNQNFTFQLGSSLQLKCEYYADHIDRLIWYKNDEIVTNSSSRSIVQGVEGSHFYSILIVNSIRPTDIGQWSCKLNQNSATFNITILNLNGQIIHSLSDYNLNQDEPPLLGSTSVETRNWVYAGVAITSLFVLLASVSIGIFYFCEPHSRSTENVHTTTDEKNIKSNNNNYYYKFKFNTANRKNKKTIDNEEQLINHSDEDPCKQQTVSSQISFHDNKIDGNLINYASSTNNNNNNNMINTTKVMTKSTDQSWNTNPSLNFLCCPKNLPTELHSLTLTNCITSVPTPSASASTNPLIALSNFNGSSSIAQQVATAENRLLVSCDSPEPKLMIATGLNPSVMEFSHTCQTVPTNSSTAQSITLLDMKSNQINDWSLDSVKELNTVKTHKPCPVHGLMKLKHMEIIDEQCRRLSQIQSDYEQYKEVDDFTQPDWTFSNSPNSCQLTEYETNDLDQNVNKHRPVRTPTNQAPWSRTVGSSSTLPCPLHGDKKIMKNKQINELNKLHLKTTQFDLSTSNDDDDDEGETVSESTSEMMLNAQQLGTNQLINTYGSAYQMYASSTEVESEVHSSRSGHSSSNSSTAKKLEIDNKVVIQYPAVKSSHKHYDNRRISYSNSIGSSLSNQIHFVNQSPCSVDFGSNTFSRSSYHRAKSQDSSYDYARTVGRKRGNPLNCPVHSKTRQDSMSISNAILYESKQSLPAFRVTTLPIHLRKPFNVEDNQIRKYASHNVIQTRPYSIHSAQSLNKLSDYGKPLIKPGSKRKLDSDSENSTNDEDDEALQRHGGQNSDDGDD